MDSKRAQSSSGSRGKDEYVLSYVLGIDESNGSREDRLTIGCKIRIMDLPFLGRLKGKTFKMHSILSDILDVYFEKDLFPFFWT